MIRRRPAIIPAPAVPRLLLDDDTVVELLARLIAAQAIARIRERATTPSTASAKAKRREVAA